MINCNPETVSTDYDTSDRLYFEPLTAEDVANVLDAEQRAGGRVVGVIVALGGQTPLKLAGSLPPELVLGTSPRLHRPGRGPGALERAVRLAAHPAASRRDGDQHVGGARHRRRAWAIRSCCVPSYVLGGRAMEIVYDDDAVRRVMHTLTTGVLAREGGGDGRASRAGRPLLGGCHRGRCRRRARRHR